MTPPPVKMVAERLHLPLYQPERIKTEPALRTLAGYAGGCALVVAYGQLLSQSLLDLFPRGVLNIHASLLPRWRGAAPIQRAILAGDAVTGVSIMLLDVGMDTGPVLARREVAIGESESFGSLHDRLARAGADLLLETLAAWKSGSLVPQAQESSGVTYAPPIRKEELRINWQLPAEQVVRLIRALDPFPGAFAHLEGRRIKCFGASLHPLTGRGRPGEIIGSGDRGLVVSAGDGRMLNIGEVQLEGQRRISADAFVRGHPGVSGGCLE